jgi:hypothetical protein
MAYDNHVATTKATLGRMGGFAFAILLTKPTLSPRMETFDEKDHVVPRQKHYVSSRPPVSLLPPP